MELLRWEPEGELPHIYMYKRLFLRFLRNGRGRRHCLSLVFLLFQGHYHIFPFLEDNIRDVE